MANSSKKVRKVVIPAAGFGTRFLPATKAQPKEMLPIVDKPIIQYVVEQAVEAGIEEIIIVTGWHKRAIEDHFSRHLELEHKPEMAGKTEYLDIIKKVSSMALSRNPWNVEVFGASKSFSSCSRLRKRTWRSSLSLASFIFSAGREVMSLSAK